MAARRLFQAATANIRKIVVTARTFDSTLQLLTSPQTNVLHNPHAAPWSRDELVHHAADAHALVCFMTDSVDAQLLDACPQLQMVACALKGFDNFDTEECARRGVAVTAVPDLLTAPTAELAIALGLGLGRHVRAGDDLVRRGDFHGWRPQLYGTGIAGSTIGIFGAGAVGLAVASCLRGFAPAKILYHDTQPLPLETERHLGLTAATEGLEQLLAESDLVFICTPLSAQTRHAISRDTLGAARRGVLLVNISRGSCVCEAAVADGLESGALGGYAADVFEFEDWAWAGRPAGIEPRLRKHPNTLFTPHLGSAVESARREIERAAATEVVRWLDGTPLLHRVN